MSVLPDVCNVQMRTELYLKASSEGAGVGEWEGRAVSQVNLRHCPRDAA
jgi:hypothetical protein